MKTTTRILWRATGCRWNARFGEIVHLCIEKDGLGFQAFNSYNDTITTKQPTAEVLRTYFPNVPITRELSEFEAPSSNRKIRDVLDFKEENNWRKYVMV